MLLRIIIVIFVGVSLLGSLLPSRAADILNSPPPPEPRLAPHQYQWGPDYWTGFYIGAHVAHGWGDGRLLFGPLVVTGPGLDLKGNYAGGQIGYNFNFRPWVIGVELDSSFGNIGRSDTSIVGGLPVTITSSINYSGTFRGRFGYALDRLLIYGTGGGAWATNQISASVPIPPNTLSASDTPTHFGWTGGGGIEFAPGYNFTVRAEYLYTAYGAATYFAGVLPGPLAAGVSADAKIQAVRVGLNYILFK